MNHAEKCELMGGAVATLFPIAWREPFGLVPIESMATGTPAIAMAMGATPETIAHGKSGFLCHTVEECIAAIAPTAELNRHHCRQHVLDRFSVATMTDGYEAVYEQLMAERFSYNGTRVNLNVA